MNVTSEVSRRLDCLTPLFKSIKLQPQLFQPTPWILQSGREELHPRVLQVVVGQIELPQVGGVGAENWRQAFAAFLWQVTATQPEEHETKEDLLICTKEKCWLSLEFSVPLQRLVGGFDHGQQPQETLLRGGVLPQVKHVDLLRRRQQDEDQSGPLSRREGGGGEGTRMHVLLDLLHQGALVQLVQAVEQIDAPLWGQIPPDGALDVLHCFLIGARAVSCLCHQPPEENLIYLQGKAQEEAEEQIQMAIRTL